MSVLIFSGSNDRAVFSFCRLASIYNVDFFIIANGLDDFIFKSEYKNNVVFTRLKNELITSEVIEVCNKIKTSHKVNDILILPSSEFLNRFLLENRNQLENESIRIPLCSKNLYEKISDKFSFNELCEKHGLNTPKQFDSAPDTYPFIIKSKTYFNENNLVGIKPQIIYNSKQYDQFFSNNNLNQYYFQEYIDGSCYYLLYYFDKEGNYSVYSQENLIQQSNGGSMILSKSSDIHHQKISKIYASLFVKEKYHGLIMVELKKCKNEFYMIEANPRFWGPSQLIIDSSMDLFDRFMFENNLIEKPRIKPEDYKKDVFYFWSGGLVKDLNQSKPSTFYNFDSNMFIKIYNQIIENEIYLKQDTIQCYLSENNYYE